MASILKVDKIRGTGLDSDSISIDGSGNTTVSGTLAVTGVHTVGNNAIYTSDGGAVTQNLVQGLAKSWSKHDNTGTISITDSFNLASISDIGTGTADFTLTNSFSNTTYSIVATCSDTSGHMQ